MGKRGQQVNGGLFKATAPRPKAAEQEQPQPVQAEPVQEAAAPSPAPERHKRQAKAPKSEDRELLDLIESPAGDIAAEGVGLRQNERLAIEQIAGKYGLKPHFVRRWLLREGLRAYARGELGDPPYRLP